MLRIIEVSSKNEDEVFLEFELKPKEDLVRSGDIDFEDPEVDRPKKKRRTDNYDSNTSGASGDYEIVDPAKDTKNEEKDPCARGGIPM
jgi:hypothetical protein